MARPNFTKAEKAHMFLTYQTYEGLKTTGKKAYNRIAPVLKANTIGGGLKIFLGF